MSERKKVIHRIARAIAEYDGAIARIVIHPADMRKAEEEVIELLEKARFPARRSLEVYAGYPLSESDRVPRGEVRIVPDGL